MTFIPNSFPTTAQKSLLFTWRGSPTLQKGASSLVPRLLRSSPPSCLPACHSSYCVQVPFELILMSSCKLLVETQNIIHFICSSWYRNTSHYFPLLLSYKSQFNTSSLKLLMSRKLLASSSNSNLFDESYFQSWKCHLWR